MKRTALYFPDRVNPSRFVALPSMGTCLCQEANDELLSHMQMVGREDLDEEQINSLVENLNKKVLPWELYNNLLPYVCVHQMDYFREVFDATIKKHYRTVEEALKYLGA
jgi:hypothetical protein